MKRRVRRLGITPLGWLLIGVAIPFLAGLLASRLPS